MILVINFYSFFFASLLHDFWFFIPSFFFAYERRKSRWWQIRVFFLDVLMECKQDVWMIFLFGCLLWTLFWKQNNIKCGFVTRKIVQYEYIEGIAVKIDVWRWCDWQENDLCKMEFFFGAFHAYFWWQPLY